MGDVIGSGMGECFWKHICDICYLMVRFKSGLLEDVESSHQSHIVSTHRRDGARLEQERVIDQWSARRAGGHLDLGGQSKTAEEESAALKQGPERSCYGCKAEEETGFSRRMWDQNQDQDQTETSTNEEEVNCKIVLGLKESMFICLC